MDFVSGLGGSFPVLGGILDVDGLKMTMSGREDVVAGAQADASHWADREL